MKQRVYRILVPEGNASKLERALREHNVDYKLIDDEVTLNTGDAAKQYEVRGIEYKGRSLGTPVLWGIERRILWKACRGAGATLQTSW